MLYIRTFYQRIFNHSGIHIEMIFKKILLEYLLLRIRAWGSEESLPSPWYKVVHQGCSPICMQQAAAQLSLEPCEDVAPNHTSWQAFWKAYPQLGMMDLAWSNYNDLTRPFTPKR